MYNVPATVASTIEMPYTNTNNLQSIGNIITFTRGYKFFELSNHLGNVLVTVSDKKIQLQKASIPELVEGYEADVVTATDYYPFGMTMPDRNFVAQSAKNYRYSFNGKESDQDINLGAIAFEARIYDSRLGRFFSTDPREAEYAWQSTYVYFKNSPIGILDFNGMGDKFFDENGKLRYESNGKSNKLFVVTSNDYDRLSKLHSGENLATELKKIATTAYSSEEAAAKDWASVGYSATKGDNLERGARIFHAQASGDSKIKDLYIIGSMCTAEKSDNPASGYSQAVDVSVSRNIFSIIYSESGHWYVYFEDLTYQAVTCKYLSLKPGSSPSKWPKLQENGTLMSDYQKYDCTEVTLKRWSYVAAIHTHPPKSTNFSVNDQGLSELRENIRMGGDIAIPLAGQNCYLVTTNESKPRMYRVTPNDAKDIYCQYKKDCERELNSKRKEIPVN